MTPGTTYPAILLADGLCGLLLALQTARRSSAPLLLLRERGRRDPSSFSCTELEAYYLGKILDLEEALFAEQDLKWDHRYLWKTSGENRRFEEYGQTSLGGLFRVPCFHVDTRRLQRQVEQRLSALGHVRCLSDCRDLSLEVREEGPHRVRWQAGGQPMEAFGHWVADTRSPGFSSATPAVATTLRLRGPLDVERLTDAPADSIRLNPQRRHWGHFPQSRATLEFMDKGLRLRLYPLKDEVQLWLLHRRGAVPAPALASDKNLLGWVERTFPLFAGTLSRLQITEPLAHFPLGEAPREPVFSRTRNSAYGGPWGPDRGFERIALHNTLLAHAIAGLAETEFTAHQFLYELLLKSLPDPLSAAAALESDFGEDQELFVLRQAWARSLYCGFLAFPFIGDFFAQQAFLLPYLEKLSGVVSLDRRLSEFLDHYGRWKAEHRPGPRRDALFLSLSTIEPVPQAQELMNLVGIPVPQAVDTLEKHWEGTRELARFLIAWVTAQVAGKPSLLHDGAVVESIHLEQFRFDPEAMGKAGSATPAKTHLWNLDAEALRPFWFWDAEGSLQETG